MNNETVLFKVIINEKGQVVADYKKPMFMTKSKEDKLNDLATDVFKTMFMPNYSDGTPFDILLSEEDKDMLEHIGLNLGKVDTIEIEETASGCIPFEDLMGGDARAAFELTEDEIIHMDTIETPSTPYSYCGCVPMEEWMSEEAREAFALTDAEIERIEKI